MESEMDLKTKDIFKGKALIDRLLIYFAKFEGSREKAARYAQKLLDLGHIESLTQSTDFEDSTHVYRWTDVASVVNKAKARVAAQEASEECKPMVSATSPPSSVVSKSQSGGRPTVRISIEADNFEGAEIQAHIRTHPHGGVKADDVSTNDNGNTFCRADMRGGKVISFVTETSKTEEILRLVPISSTMIEDPRSDRKEANVTQHKITSKDDTSTHSAAESIWNHEYPKSFSGRNDKSKDISKIAPSGKENTEDRDSTSENRESESSRKSALVYETSIVQPGSPGQGATPVNTYTDQKSIGTKRDSPIRSTLKDDTPYTQNSKKSADSEKRKQSGTKYKWNKGGEEKSTTDDQTANKNKAHNEFDDRKWDDSGNHPRPHPRGYSPVTGGNRVAPEESQHSLTSTSSLSDSASSQSPTGSPKVHPRKLKFKNDHDWIRIRQEYLANEEIRQITEQRGSMVVVDNTAALHSSSQLDDFDRGKCDNSKCETIKEADDDVGDGQTQALPATSKEYSPEEHTLSIPVTPLIEISPPPSPSPPSPSKQTDAGMKSLFWTKIVCDKDHAQESEGLFWMNIKKDVKFDEEEFKKLFSKPPPSPQQKRSRGRYSHEQEGDGKTLKVLGTERSRHIGIRASSVHLPIEEIHDAIVTMDDSLLDCDALEALYDVRPTPEELDDIADVLKHHPNGILDKPEQFLLMMAMISNLDERLKSWIFAKKFPDKVFDIRDQLNALSNACVQIVRNETLQNILEATLSFGNFMNQGTQRGDADGYFLDILPKLKDLKSQNGETNLLQYSVRWMIGQEDEKISKGAKKTQVRKDDDEEDDCKLPEQSLLQKASAVALQDVIEELENLAAELYECREQLLPSVIQGGTCIADIKPFSERMNEFIQEADQAMEELQNLSAETSEIAGEFRRYYIPGEDKSVSLSSMLKHMEKFCEDFRMYWDAEKRKTAKETYFNTEKARRQRMAAVKIATSPSALKARFLEKRKREKGPIEGRPAQNISNGRNASCTNQNSAYGDQNMNGTGQSRLHRHSGNTTEENGGSASSRRSVKWKERTSENGSSSSQSPATRRNATPRRAALSLQTQPERSNKVASRHTRCGENGTGREPQKKDSQLELYLGKARKNSLEIEEKLVIANEQSGGMSRMKKAMMQRRMMLKSKTC